jgi:hypothetical protein
MKTMLVIVMGLMLTACSTPQATTVAVTASTFCKVATYIDWSMDDTEETVNQVRRHNARVASCKKSPVTS